MSNSKYIAFSKYVCPRRADLRTSQPHIIASSRKLNYINGTDAPIDKSKKIRNLDSKIQILKEILRFKKALNRYDQKTKEIENKSNEIEKKNNLFKPQTPAIIPLSMPQINIFKKEKYVVLNEDLQPFPNIIIELMNHIYAPPFNVPVDYVRLNIPDYPKKIKKPMDLGTIKYGLETGKYVTPNKIINDIRQVWINAQTYNPPGNQFNTMANVLSEMFESRLKEIGMENIGLNQQSENDITFNSILNPNNKLNDYDLSESDYDPATGDTIELSIYEKNELKKRITSLRNAHQLKTVVDIIQTDSKYKNKDLSQKLEFELSNLSNSVVRKLYKYVNSIPNIEKIVKDVEKKQLDPSYHLKQLNTKISNEFSSDRSALIESVKQNKVLNLNGKLFDSGGKNINPIGKIDLSKSKEKNKLNSQKNLYYSKLLEESSSSSSEDEDELIPKNNLKSEVNKEYIPEESSNKKVKVMWNWKPKVNQNNVKISPFNKPQNPLKNNNFNFNNNNNNFINNVNKNSRFFTNYVEKRSTSSSFSNTKMNSNIQQAHKNINQSKFPANFITNMNNQNLNKKLSAKETARLEREKQKPVDFNLTKKSLLSMQRRFE